MDVPLRIERLESVDEEDANDRESKVTAEMMWAHSVNHVRGAALCDARSFGPNDMEMITRYIAHAARLELQ